MRTYYVGVTSHNRTDTIGHIHYFCGEDVVWYVGDGEKDAYLAAGAKHVVESGKLIPTRNRILEDGFALGLPTVQLSDDLQDINECYQVSANPKRNALRPMDFDDAVQQMISNLKESRLMLAGVSPTDNPLWFSPDKAISTRSFVIGDFTVSMPNDIRYDERFTLKEDYDYTMQHIAKYGGVIRMNAIMPDFLHYSPGGVADVRDADQEAYNVRLLQQKWGKKYIRNHPRRPNEVILSIPNRK